MIVAGHVWLFGHIRPCLSQAISGICANNLQYLLCKSALLFRPSEVLGKSVQCSCVSLFLITMIILQVFLYTYNMCNNTHALQFLCILSTPSLRAAVGYMRFSSRQISKLIIDDTQVLVSLLRTHQVSQSSTCTSGLHLDLGRREFWPICLDTRDKQVLDTPINELLHYKGKVQGVLAECVTNMQQRH